MSREYNKRVMKIRIEQVALALLKEKSYSLVSMDEIAKHSNITKRTLYQYFPSKSTLFVSLFENYLKRLHAEIAKVMNEDSPSGSKLNAAIRTLFAFSNETPVYMRLFRIVDITEVRDEIPVELLERIRLWNQGIRDQFLKGLQAEEVSRFTAGYSPELLAHLIEAVNRGIFFQTFGELQMPNTSKVTPKDLQEMFLNLIELAIGRQ